MCSYFAGALPNSLRVFVDVGALIALELGLMLAGRRLGLRRRMPRVIDLYMEGQLPLDRLVTRIYALDEINDAFAAMNAGATRKNPPAAQPKPPAGESLRAAASLLRYLTIHFDRSSARA